MSDAFDHYKDTYETDMQRSIDFVGQDHDFFTRSKARHLIRLVRRNLGPTEQLSALDVGCGVGVTDALIQSDFRSVHGADVAEGVVERAAAANPWVEYRTYDGDTLPFPDGSFDVVFAICVLHHVPPPERERFVAEMNRVARGLVAVFEHNPLNPLTRLAVARCAFDEDAVLLSKRGVKRLLLASEMRIVEERYILFLPWMMEFSQRLDRLLPWFPLGAQHVTVARATRRHG